MYTHFKGMARRDWSLFDPFYYNKDIGIVLEIIESKNYTYSVVYWPDGDTTTTSVEVLEKIDEG